MSQNQHNSKQDNERLEDLEELKELREMYESILKDRNYLIINDIDQKKTILRLSIELNKLKGDNKKVVRLSRRE